MEGPLTEKENSNSIGVSCDDQLYYFILASHQPGNLHKGKVRLEPKIKIDMVRYDLLQSKCGYITYLERNLM